MWSKWEKIVMFPVEFSYVEIFLLVCNFDDKIIENLS